MKKINAKDILKKPNMQTCIAIHRVLIGIGNNLFKLFYPVLIYNATGSLFLAAVYIALKMFVCTSLIFLFRKLYYRNALIFVFTSTILTLVMQLIFTFDITFTVELVILLGILTGFVSATYNTPMNTLFSANKGASASKNLQRFETAALIGKIVAPAIGGLLLSSGNMIVSFVIACIIYVSSSLVLCLHAKQVKLIFRRIELEKPQTIFKIVKKQNAFYMAYWFLLGVQDMASSYLWPLLLVVKNVNIASIGYITSIALACQFIAQFIAGYISKKEWYIPSSICMFLRSAILMAMPFIISPVTMYLYSIITGLLQPIYNNPFKATFMEFSANNNMLLTNMVKMDVSYFGGEAVASIMLLCGTPITIALLIAASPFLYQWGSFWVIKYQRKHKINVCPTAMIEKSE